MMGSRRFATALLLLCLGFFGISSSRADDGAAKHFFPAAPGAEAPSFVVRDEQGRERVLRDLLRDVPPEGEALIVFWARWCAPCVKELPSLAAFAGAQNKISVFLVSEEAEETGTLKAFLSRRGIENIPFYGDGAGDAARILKVAGLPAAVLITQKGRLLGTFLGPVDWQSPETRALLSKLGG